MFARSVMVLALLMALAALPSPARGEPIQVTGGTVQVQVNLLAARITFEGDGFFLSTGTEDFFSSLGPSPFSLDTPANLGGEWRPTDSRGGSARFEGVDYPEVHIGLGQSRGTFVTPSVQVTEPRATVTVPFTFTGFVTAFAVHSPGPDDEPFFTTELTGTGTARARFDILPASGGLPAVYFPIALEGADYHIEYNFSPSPIPEPATLLLVGGGLAAGVARRRRR
jgi:hypothetical protein